jgi:CubicO group peptidase (beta-lactamase class C family)
VHTTGGSGRALVKEAASVLHGHIDPRFTALRDLLEEQLGSGAQRGIAVCVTLRGEPVVDAFGGDADARGTLWQADTGAVVFSTTKGVTAACLHLLAERGQLDLDDPVTRHWPEFARLGRERGKQRTTIRHVMSHRAAIPQCPDDVHDLAQLLDFDAMARRMEALIPEWEPGGDSAYHARNYGFIVGELVRRVSGRRIGTFLQDEIAGPLGLRGLHIGLPRNAAMPVATLENLPGAAGHELTPNPEISDPTSIAARTMLKPHGDLAAFMNQPEARAAEIPSSGGIATARDLATLYACLGAGGTLNGVRLWSPETLARATALQVAPDHRDRVIGIPMRWACGFHKGGPFTACGPNPNAFGHAGYGGSLAFADPDAGLAIALVPNLLGSELQTGLRMLRAVKAIYDGLSGTA